MTTFASKLDSATDEMKEEIRNIYNRLATEYDERIPGSGPADELFTATESAFLLDRVQPGEHVLDIGCGTGRFTVPMAESGAQVSGLDLSQGMLDVLGAKLSDKGLKADLRQGDMSRMPFPDNSFDVVTSMLALMHVPLADRPAVFREVSRVLKPGGRMLLGVKNGIFERLFTGDRFATVDITDVDNKRLIFTGTGDGKQGNEFEAAWYSFTPQELNLLFGRVGMTVTNIQGNIPLGVWLAQEVLADPRIRAAVSAIESTLADVPPFNHFGYHLLVEAVKPEV